jgi:hypothetical protein
MGKRVSHVMLTELVLENRETPSLLTLDADWVFRTEFRSLGRLSRRFLGSAAALRQVSRKCRGRFCKAGKPLPQKVPAAKNTRLKSLGEPVGDGELPQGDGENTQKKPCICGVPGKEMLVKIRKNPRTCHAP